MKKFVNFLTLFRFFITFLLPIMWKKLNPVVLIIFITAILLTDFFDGFLARKFNVQTFFGMLADTLADKFFGIVIVILIAFYYKEYYLIAFMELTIAFINIIAGFLGATVKSSFLGRFKMWLLGIATVTGIFYINYNDLLEIQLIHNFILFFGINIDYILLPIVYITVGAEIMVAIDYLKHICKELKNDKKKIKYNFKKGNDLKYVLFDTDYYLNNKNKPMSKHLLY